MLLRVSSNPTTHQPLGNRDAKIITPGNDLDDWKTAFAHRRAEEHKGRKGTGIDKRGQEKRATRDSRGALQSQ